MSDPDDNLPDDPAALRALVGKLQTVLAERDEALAERDEALAKKDEALAEKSQALAEKVEALAEKEEVLRIAEERDARMRERIAWLHRKLFGRSSEKVHLADFDEILAELGLLFGFETGDSRSEEERSAPGDDDEPDVSPDEAAPADGDEPSAEDGDTAEKAQWVVVPEYRRKRRKGHGRRPLPPGLPRVRHEHELSEEERRCPCCQEPMARIGTLTTKLLEFLPVYLYVLVHARAKYACKRKGCEGQTAPVVAPLPPLPIHKGLAGPALLAHVLVGKYADHLPLHRLLKIFSRHGAKIAESTLGGWVEACADKLGPVAERLTERVLSSRIVQTDDTRIPVQVMAPRSEGQARGPPGKTKDGHLWAYLGDRHNPFVVFDYTPDWRGEGPRGFLASFRGKLQADGYAGYEKLYQTDGVEKVGCNAHARRYFLEALSDPARSKVAAALYKALYRIERRARDEKLDPDARLALRQAESVPVFARLVEWVEAEEPKVPPQSAIAKAIRYFRNQQDALARFLEDGELEIDNTASERALRAVAIGRKNWMFAGSDAGARRAAVLYSVIQSAERCGLDPEAYLRSILTELANLPREDAERRAAIDALMPDRWAGDSDPADHLKATLVVETLARAMATAGPAVE